MLSLTSVKYSVEQRQQSGDRGETSGAKQLPEKSQWRRLPWKLGSSGNGLRKEWRYKERWGLARLFNKLLVQ